LECHRPKGTLRTVKRRFRVLAIVVPIVVAALELSHPNWSEGAVSQAVLATGALWLPLHVLLLAGYGVLVWLLWVLQSRGVGRLPRAAALPRIALVVFLVANTAFLGTDGLAVGLLAGTDPGAADRLWNGEFVEALADLTGAAWAASLLSVAAFVSTAGRTRPALVGLGLTWLTFVVSAPPLAAPPIFSRLAALATGAGVVYATGNSGVSFALLVFAAVLHQHVGAEAALGMLMIGFALARLPEPG
jgi:hypothetical protein